MVLWFGGILVLDYGRIDGPTIIIYLVMLYSIINPLKEFSKASYNIPKGLDRKSTRLNSSHMSESRMPSSA